MKKSPQHITILVMLWAFFMPLLMAHSNFLFGQEKCASALILSEKYSQNTAVSEQQFERWLQRKKESRPLGLAQRSSQVIQVPVIFHIIHRGEEVGTGVNISKERIDRQLVTLNEDFNQQNADASATLPEFADLAASIEIEFVYAKQTPDGYPTNGINRQAGNQSDYTYQQRETLASESFWPPEDYINIWITDIKAPSLGWAEFPSTTLEGINEGNIRPNADGIAIDYQFLGDNPNSPSFESKGRTLTHEMGHFFGLRHIWGDGGCNADDFCEDTPPSSESSIGCTLTKETCNSLDMVQNFMDYTNDACMTLFTQDQKFRIQTVLENSPRRSSLINSNALNEPPVYANDAGIILSKPSAYRSSCANSYIPNILVRNLGTDTLKTYTLRLYTLNNLIETILIDDRPLASGDETKVFFSEILTENIIDNNLRYQITINGSIDERPENNENTEYIQTLNRKALPYSIDFSNNINDWYIRNPDNQESWSSSITGLYLPTFKKRARIGQTDALISPIYDFTTIGIPEISLIYAQSDDSIQNRLSIYASYDCGETFQELVFSKASDEIVTAYNSLEAFVPEYRLDWDTLKIDLASMRDQASVSFKIEVENRGANDFHLKDFSVVESSRNDREITPIGWNKTNAVFCDGPLAPELLLKNTGRNAVISFRLLLKEGNTIYRDEVINKVVLSQQTITLALPAITTSKNKGTMTAIIETTDNEQIVSKSIILPYQRLCEIELPPVRLDLALNSENNLITFNPNVDQSWTYDETVNMISSNSASINNIDSQDWLISPIIDVSDIDYVSLIFDVAYQKPFLQSEGLFIILQPIDTNSNERVIYFKTGDSLATAFSNKPGGAVTTRNELVDLSPYLFLEQFRLIFKATHQNGANIYLNDISLFLGQDLPPDFPSTQKPFVIYPNPVRDGQLNLHFNLPLAEAGTLTVTDVHGKIIRQFNQPKVLNQFVQFNFSDLASGLYILHFNSPTIQRSEKFIIE